MPSPDRDGVVDEVAGGSFYISKTAANLNQHFGAQIGFDVPENGPSKVLVLVSNRFRPAGLPRPPGKVNSPGRPRAAAARERRADPPRGLGPRGPGLRAGTAEFAGSDSNMISTCCIFFLLSVT